MQQIGVSFEDACSEISHNLLAIAEPTSKDVKREVKRICIKYSLERIPRNYEILASVGGQDFIKLQKALVRKPVKTASGVAVIALMPKPYACPHGRCTYCPGGIEFNTPNSYTGREPSTQNAILNSYDPKKQVLDKLEHLISYGHDSTKLELVIVGGTFLFMPQDYQISFIKSCFDALNGFDSEDLESAKKNNENANIRNVGFTIETKPDYCKSKHVDWMLDYGITRVEIGVQSLHDKVYQIVNRGHTFRDVVESFQISKDAGYKIVAHMMPGLPTMTPEEDIEDFKKMFSDPALKPDMLKIYPTLVLENTPLYESYKKGEFSTYSQDDMIKVLTEMKKIIPRWARIMRMQREISSDQIIAGPNLGNLRQIVQQNLKKQNLSCKCIRCREAGLSDDLINIDDIKMNRENYESSGGHEVFLSYDDSNDKIFGFLRLRKPSAMAHRPETTQNTCIVRELHVYGKSLKLGKRDKDSIQHLGLGKNLVRKAERISKEEFDAKNLLVISAVGTREYYRKLGYSLCGPYMSKELV
ncbi:MAG TPA: tRNA uridine(34) 5-carboxymethylaminomethyl modification radical SAM/GNAT enzyme Elp3 [Candidatus Nitrosotalea sp.]|nr:tRNA uridine(34) 5-carboxymethylaminomethyl modification radical SAM/GNAT enzyme Elp3 [Candidatus Nitrosotalea sp.]